MFGTLRRALVARKVGLDLENYTASVEGTVEGIDGTIRITAIDVHYELSIDTGKREATERALEVHARGCPAHESVKDAIRITWSASIREAPREGTA